MRLVGKALRLLDPGGRTPGLDQEPTDRGVVQQVPPVTGATSVRQLGALVEHGPQRHQVLGLDGVESTLTGLERHRMCEPSSRSA